MNSAIFYASSIVFTGAGFFFLWQFGIKPLLLDNFRDDLFRVRDRLYLLAQEGRLECDSPAYRAVEAFINRTIQFAHRFTFLSFAMFALTEKIDQSTTASPYDSLMKTIEIVRDKSVRTELLSIVSETLTLLPRYIGKSSIMFIFGSVMYLALRSVFPFVVQVKRLAINIFEVEAYREANYLKAARA